METSQMLDRIVPLFLEGGRFYGRYRVDPDNAPSEIYSGALWEVPVFPIGSQSCDLMRVYGLDTTAGPLLQALWRNETRALLRLSTRGQRALPRFKEAELLAALDVGYVIVSDSGRALASDSELLSQLQTNRRHAFLGYFSIVDAVAAMHEEGLLHRNLTQHALRVGDDRETIVIDDFQMSSFVAARFGASAFSPASILAATDPTARWMLAPERLAAREGQPVRSVESYATDVFSLGMIGIWLHLGVTPPPSAYSAEAHRMWVSAQHAALRRAKLPIALERALETMTAMDRRNRIPSGVAVHELLAKAYGSILYDLEWRSEEPERIYELLYLRDSIERMYDDGWGRSHPSDPDYPEYNRLIEQDLVGAVLTWSPHGFEPWERFGDRAVARQAKVVLLGRNYAYFCAYLDSGRPTEDRSRIVVKHMLPSGRSGALRRAPRQRAAPRVACAHFSPGKRRPPRIPGTNAWSEIVSTVEHEGGRSFSDPVVATARWLLDAQRADVRRSWYLVEQMGSSEGTLTLRDVGAPEPDAADLLGAFDRLWSKTVEPEPMGSTFSRVAERARESDESLLFLVKRDREDRDHVAELELIRPLDRDTCLFRITAQTGVIGDRMWIMADDRRARTQFRRQADALLEVEQRYGHLAAQIRSPRSVRIPPDVSKVKPPSPADPNEPLLRQIQETWPLFALQGPPGTGKTFIAAELLERELREDRLGRFLVAAQSHHALDNLLRNVIARVPEAPALRISSDGTFSLLSDQAKTYTLSNRVPVMMSALSAAGGPRPPDALRRLVTEWRRLASRRDVELEADLARRLPRASSIVFTTCGQATHDALGGSRGAGSFDWIIIEEAARGWITEFFIPLVHGARWLLIGDHAQLPAHRQRELETLLSVDIRDQITTSATGVAPVDEWRRYLRYFAHIMQISTGRTDEPRARLLTQRRMDTDIAGLISESFYGGSLGTHKTARRPHGIEVPPFAGTSLVWLDTSGLGPDAYEYSDGGLRNHCEMVVLRHFFRNQVGDPKRFEDEIEPLAVLSPYRAQRDLLRDQLGYSRDIVRTVDSFQGGEAEVVLVSMVRNNASDTVEKAIGFLEDPSRVNVMLSRARRLLVIAGSLAHFERHGHTLFWERICRYVRADQRFVFNVADSGFSYRRGPR